LLEGPQCVERPRHAQDQQPIHGKAEEIEAHPVGLAAFDAGEVSLDQERRFCGSVPRNGSCRDRERKTEGSAQMGWPRRTELVQSGAGEPARKDMIDRRQPERQQGLRHIGRKALVWLNSCERPPKLAERLAGARGWHGLTGLPLSMFLI